MTRRQLNDYNLKRPTVRENRCRGDRSTVATGPQWFLHRMVARIVPIAYLLFGGQPFIISDRVFVVFPVL